MTNQQLLKYFFLFVIAFLLFSYFQYFPTFPDPDSFYHAKMAVLTREQGVVKDFPWLHFTILKDYYIDHHFLYHVFLVPFTTFIDPIAGTKLATAFLGALSILIFYWFLEQFKIKGAFFYSLLLLFVSPFIFRINLAKASSLSIIVLFLGLYFIFHQKYWHLFVLSFIYVWTFNGWPLIFIAVSLYIIADLVVKTINHLKGKKLEIENWKFIGNWKLVIGNLIKTTFPRTNLKLLFSCCGGLIAGIIINPYFPKNIYFYWQHIVQIAVINYQEKIRVGAEWYPYELGNLISNTSTIFILLILSLSYFFIKFLKNYTNQETGTSLSQSKKIQILTTALLTLFFLALTLRSRRNVEYFVPFAALFGAFSLSQPLTFFKHYLHLFFSWWQKKKIVASTLCLYFCIFIPLVISRDVWSLKQFFTAGYHAEKYKGVSQWLKNNTPANSIIFHNDWDDFPPLFYYNTHNRYIAGLDPTFMYNYNQELYQKWVDITTTRVKNVSQTIKNDFGAGYVFVDKDHVAFENNLKTDGNFILVYKDEEGKVYKLSNF